MDGRKAIGRRDVLLGMGASGLAGAGLSSTAMMQAGRAFAANGPLKQVNIVNPEGDFTSVCQQLLVSGKYFQSFGLNARILSVSDGTKIIAALVSGSADFCGGGGFAGVFPAIERGAKIKILGGAALSPLDAVYAKNPDIKSAKDLVGRTVGVGAPGALLHEMMVALLQKAGVDYKQVKFVNIGAAPDVFKAVVAGTVDAGPSEVDYSNQTQKYGVHMLSDGALYDVLPQFTNQAFLASDQIIAEKRDILVKTLAVFAKLFRFVVSPGSKDAWIEARKVALGSDNPVDAETEWEFFQAPNRLATNLILSQDRVSYIQKLNVELGVQKKVLPFDQVADMSLAEEALKLLS